MKKKLLLALSSILLAVGLLVGCSEEPGLENDQMQNENSQPGEMEIDPPVNEADTNADADEDINAEMNGEMNADTDEDMNAEMNGEMNADTEEEINGELDEKKQP